ncbi:MAG TPA: hypothetical protein VF519_13030 [Mycobacteriales bacterium]|jgi:uncharacterized membrane protein
MRAARTTVTGLATLVATSAFVAVATPALAACSTQLIGKNPGQASTCYSYASGYVVTVENGSVYYTVSCWGSVYNSGTVTAALPRIGTLPGGGCQAALTIVAQASGTIAYGYLG